MENGIMYTNKWCTTNNWKGDIACQGKNAAMRLCLMAEKMLKDKIFIK